MKMKPMKHRDVVITLTAIPARRPFVESPHLQFCGHTNCPGFLGQDSVDPQRFLRANTSNWKTTTYTDVTRDAELRCIVCGRLAELRALADVERPFAWMPEE